MEVKEKEYKEILAEMIIMEIEVDLIEIEVATNLEEVLEDKDLIEMKLMLIKDKEEVTDQEVMSWFLEEEEDLVSEEMREMISMLKEEEVTNQEISIEETISLIEEKEDNILIQLTNSKSLEGNEVDLILEVEEDQEMRWT